MRRGVHIMGVESMLILGLLISVLGGMILLMMSRLLPDSGLAVLFASGVYVLGARLVIPNASSLAMGHTHFPKGSVSALMGAIQMMGAVLLGGLMAQFKTKTACPLAIFFISTSSAALILCYVRLHLTQFSKEEIVTKIEEMERKVEEVIIEEKEEVTC